MAYYAYAPAELVMTDTSIGFLPQPFHVLANAGETFASDVLEALEPYAGAHAQRPALEAHGGRLWVIEVKAQPHWNIFLLPSQGDRGPMVCALDFGSASQQVAALEPLIWLTHLSPLMALPLSDAKPAMFKALDMILTAPAAPAVTLQLDHPNKQIMAGLVLSKSLRALGRRWGSSQARTHFRDVFDGALHQPQIVEREEGDVVVVSTDYLDGALAGGGARGLAEIYGARRLSKEGLGQRARQSPRSLAPLRELAAR